MLRTGTRPLFLLAGLCFLLGSTSLCLAQGPASDPLKRSGFFGTQLGPITEEQQATLKLPAKAGVLVMKVFPGGSAEAVGLKPNDVIVAVNDSKIAGVPEFLASIAGRKEGEKLALSYIRDAKEQKAEITLKPRPMEKSDSYEVTYGSIESKGGRLRTITTRPKGEGKFPVLYFIQGLGNYSIEGTPAAPGPFARFIDVFNQNGFATFRVEKPGQGDSEGGPTRDLDFETEFDGYKQGLKALKKIPYIDPDKILIFGHSMGGVMGPLVAAAEGPVKGIAAYGTASKTWTEYILENTRRQMALAGAAESEIDEGLRKDSAIHYLLQFADKSPEEISKSHPDLADRISEMFDSGKYFSGRHYVFFRQLANKNLAAAWEAFNGHSLTMWGNADYISTEYDHALVAQIVNRKNPGNGKFLVIEGTDHGFNKSPSQQEAIRNFGKPGEFNPQVIKELSDWAKHVIEAK